MGKKKKKQQQQRVPPATAGTRKVDLGIGVGLLIAFLAARGVVESQIYAGLLLAAIGAGGAYFIWTRRWSRRRQCVASVVALCAMAGLWPVSGRLVNHRPPPFQSHPELRLSTPFYMCGVAECYYRLDLDGAGLMIVDDVRPGAIHFAIRKGPFVSASSADRPHAELPSPYGPPLRRDPSQLPPDVDGLSASIVSFGAQLGEVKFDTFAGKTHTVTASGRTFEVTLTSYDSQIDAKGVPHYVFAFAVNEQQ